MSNGGKLFFGALIGGGLYAASRMLSRDVRKELPPATQDVRPIKAWIFRRSTEISFRMWVGPTIAEATEHGIFGTPEKALEIANQNGWTIALPSPGWKELDKLPSEKE